MLRKIIRGFWLVMAIYFVIAGRGATFHLTEGEALAQGGFFWAMALACVGASVVFSK